MAHIIEKYDAVVVGAGHAGCEAALALARRGIETVIFTVSVDSIAMMPCNPNIGGSSKGHLVREVDALGGEMGKNIDRTFIQSKMLGVSKGPAVHSLRAQADKKEYSGMMRRVLEEQDHLTIRQAEVADILTDADIESVLSEERELRKSEQNKVYPPEDATFAHNDPQSFPQDGVENVCKVAGVRLASGAVILAKTVILATGVYLKSRCIYGDVSQETGPSGLMRASLLSDSLRKNGIGLVRFKTGTPARIDRRSIDFSKMTEQKGDDRVVPFSFSTDPGSVQIPQESCYLTYTNKTTHDIIRANIDRSPLYGGQIKGTGPRYCPSIEDKVVRFADKERHQVFIEPEGRYTNEMYIDGMSSSMPEDVQIAMYRSVPGLENAKIVRNAYAIEYDCLAPGQLKTSLEFRKIKGLFSAGQFNGSSGYEEAAAQGIMAGINAGNYVLGKPMLVLMRSEGYIGVLIDDLVTKENHEPYRMMTSRAEYRLLLRQDNADRRLRRYGYEAGLVTDEQMEKLMRKEELIASELERIKKTHIGTSEEVQSFLESKGSSRLESGITLAELVRRPELSYQLLEEIDKDRPDIPFDVAEQVDIECKYEGYIKRQEAMVQEAVRAEKVKIPQDIDYNVISSLRLEARAKLNEFRPDNIGQASRIAGVTPADIAVLMVALRQK